MWGGGSLLTAAKLCISRQHTSATSPPVLVQLLRCCSTYSRTARRCGSLAMLHGAVERGHNLIPEPQGVQRATEAEMADLFPFTWNISQFRGRSIGERGLIVHYMPQAEPHPAQRGPSGSYFSITYPFTANKVLRDQYQRFSSPFLRVGLVLEDLDSFAADVASRHLGGLPPGYTVVTAAIDKLALTTAGPPAAPPAAAAAAVDPHAQRSSADNAAEHSAGPLQQQQQQQQQEGLRGADDHDELRLRRQLSQRVSLDVTQYPLSIYSDLRMVGQVCWAGRSSMEVLVELSTAAPSLSTAAPAATTTSTAAADSNADTVRWTPRAVAHFVMVLAKSQQQPGVMGQHQQQAAAAAAAGPAWGVPAVVPHTPLEQQHYDKAAQRAAQLKAKRAAPSLLSGVEPGADEVHLLYQLAEDQLAREIRRQQQQEEQGAAAGSSSSSGQQQQQQQQDGSSAPHPPPPVPMASTSQSHLAVMHAQDRNNAHNIFGGHLLKLAAELAYSTAVLHAGRHCEAVALGDVSFRRPVPIGCVLSFRAKVVYTSGHLLRVSVVATKHQQLLERPSELHASVTNDFSFVFCAVGCHPLRPVEPESLREAVQFLAAHRQHQADGYRAPPALLQPGMEHVLTSMAVT